MKITGAWIDHPGTQALCRALETAGYRALFVGGCVRNALLGTKVSDIDIATDARPEVVTDVAQHSGFRVVPTGLLHGTVTVIAQHLPLEVTTFRRDVQTDGRHAVVAFATDVTIDASRRDFTMNALYADRTGTVIDPLGGLPDLTARRVRFVGDARLRIREDYLRILRFFRFHAWYGDPDDGIDPDALAACAELAEGVEGLSRERVGAEIKKLLAAADPAPAFAAMGHCGVLARVLPGADPQALGALVHVEGDVEPAWLRRLAVIGGEAVPDRLRLSRAEERDLDALRAAIGSLETPAVLGWRMGYDRGRDAVLLRACMTGLAVSGQMTAEVARGAASRFPVDATDLMPAYAGAALGARLRQIEARWLASDLRASRADLLG